MTLGEIDKLNMQLELARAETFKEIILYYKNDLSAVKTKEECMKTATEIFNNSFRMLNTLRENVKGGNES